MFNFLGYQGPPTVVLGAPTTAGGPRMYKLFLLILVIYQF